MKLVREIIDSNLDSYEHFGYYGSIIEIIEQNLEKNPDISIESCKALVEGISKAILKSIDASYSDTEIESLDFQPLFKKMLNKLSDYTLDIEIDFTNRACSLIHMLGEIRNKRGDISHGKLAPKQFFSTAQFSQLVSQLTEGMLYFLLNSFFSIDFSEEKEVEYDDNGQFNIWLDESNPLPGLSFSRALFHQDLVVYKQQLTDYQTSLEEV